MAEAQVGLSRSLGLFDVTLIGVGAMIGAGIFVLTGIAADIAGPAVLLAFALNGLVTLLTAMTYAELGSALPEAGGGYLWVKHALGDLQSFIAGWMSWFAHAVAGALYALGFGSYAWVMLEEYLHFVAPTPGSGPVVLSVAVTFLFLYINYRGARATGRAGNIVTLAKLAIILLFIVGGLFAIGVHPERLDSFEGFFADGWTAVLAAMGLTFIAFEGYEIIAQAGEEVRDPRKNIPRAIFLSLLIVVPFYILTAFAAIGAVVPPAGAGSSAEYIGSAGELGLLRAAEQFMPLGGALLIIGALVSTMSALNATTFSSTRVAFAMGRDRILHGVLGRVSRRTRTPDAALGLSGLLMLFMVVYVPIHAVAAAAGIMFLLLFLQVNFAAIRLRKAWQGKVTYGYRTPLFPLVPVLGMVTVGVLAVFLFFYEPFAWLLALGWMVGGFLIYVAFGKDYQAKEKAGSRFVFEEKPVDKPSYSILVPVSNPVTLPAIVEEAVAIAQAHPGADIDFVALVSLPKTLPLAEGARYAPSRRAMLDEAERLVAGRVPVRKAVRVGRDIAQDILFTASEHRVNLMLLGWGQFETWRWRGGRGAREPSGTAFAPAMREVIENAPCDVVVVRAGIEHDVRHVMSPIGGDRHDPLSVTLGVALAKRRGIPFVGMHVLPPDASDEARRAAHEMMDRVAEEAEADPRDAQWTLVPEADRRAAIRERSTPREVMVLGASERAWYETYLFGETADYLAEHATGTIVLVKHYEGRARRTLRDAARELVYLVRGAAEQAERAAAEDFHKLHGALAGDPVVRDGPPTEKEAAAPEDGKGR